MALLTLFSCLPLCIRLHIYLTSYIWVLAIPIASACAANAWKIALLHKLYRVYVERCHYEMAVVHSFCLIIYMTVLLSFYLWDDNFTIFPLDIKMLHPLPCEDNDTRSLSTATGEPQKMVFLLCCGLLDEPCFP